MIVGFKKFLELVTKYSDVSLSDKWKFLILAIVSIILFVSTFFLQGCTIGRDIPAEVQPHVQLSIPDTVVLYVTPRDTFRTIDCTPYD